MTSDPIFYIMIALAAAFAISTILLCIGCNKAGTSKLKRDLTDFSKECNVMLARLDKFENRLVQFPENMIESVEPIISEHIRKQMELRIRECLDNTRQEVKIEDETFDPTEVGQDFDSVECYRHFFLSAPEYPFLSKEGKQVTIREGYHKLISALVNTSNGECRSIYHYVDNVLKNHFIDYGETIRTLLGISSEKVNGV